MIHKLQFAFALVSLIGLQGTALASDRYGVVMRGGKAGSGMNRAEACNVANDKVIKAQRLNNDDKAYTDKIVYDNIGPCECRENPIVRGQFDCEVWYNWHWEKKKK